VLAEVHEQLTPVDGNSEQLCDVLYGEIKPAELLEFRHGGEPTHLYRTQGIDIERSVRLSPAHDQVELTYRVRGAQGPVLLGLTPILRCRPLHELTHANPFLDGSLSADGSEVRMLPYMGMPGLAFAVYGAPASLEERGVWYPGVYYQAEAERGYEAREDLFSPGTFTVELPGDGEFTFAVALERTVPPERTAKRPSDRPRSDRPHRGSELARRLEQAALQFAMRGRDGSSAVIAGFPWFGPWSRDTLIALPGLHLTWGDFERTAALLESLLSARVRGLIPNIPALAGETANTSSVDATLLFVRAVQWLGQHEGADRVARFMPATCELLEALADGSDPRMRLDDGIGVWTERGAYALTWMDAMVHGQPVTPRAGYAVEIDALAYNAATFAVGWADGQKGTFARAFKPRLRDAETRFLARYWLEARGYLADAHDGRYADGSLRPNQLWALALPHRLVPTAVARASLDAVTRELLTPAGLRTLSPQDPAYRLRYAGTQTERDQAYHQGTVWPWLLGIYADAVVATRGRDALEPLLAPAFEFFARHLDSEGCVGQVSEVFSGDAPFVAGGAPAQAWSVTELLRTHQLLHGSERMAQPTSRPAARKAKPAQKDTAEKR
jgi:predicted glycogen debranching enzyme